MLEQSLNLARRLSVGNEGDLLQEEIFTTEEPKYNRKFCERLAQTISTETDVPQQCRDFDTVMIMVRRRESKRSAQAVAFEGMTPAEAASAIAARERGHLNPMQIQRRMTNRKSNRVW